MSGNDYDLSFVDPHRREEVRRRIAAIRRFLAAPGRKAAEEAAAQLGMSYVSFYTLVRSWKEYSDPARLPGSGNRRAKSALPDEQMAIIRRADQAAPGGGVPEAIEMAFVEARRRGVDMPTAVTIRKYLLTLRRGRPSSALGEVDFVVDHGELDIPVASAGETVRPLLSAVLDIAKARVIGYALSIGAPTVMSTASALSDALRRRHLGGDLPSRIMMDRPATDQWEQLASDLTKAGIEIHGDLLPDDAMSRDVGHHRDRRNGRAIALLIGHRVAGVRLFVRNNRTGSGARLKKGAEPLSLGQANELVEERLAIPDGTAIMDRRSKQLALRLNKLARPASS